ncbi:histidine kinase [Streptosporangium sp. NPDC023615]|uniref:sensor histidine kinase n=1 Tax=Streptosporangium sp. NPDC023615 TaxID=3154794 RepID=UPI003415EEBA
MRRITITGVFRQRLRWVRVATLGSLATAVLMTLAMPGFGLGVETDPLRIALGATGILVFAAAQAAVLYAAVTPSLSQAVHRRLLAGFATAAALSVPLTAPLGGGDWKTWAWVGASIVGTAPLLGGRATAVAVMAAAVAVSGVVGWWSGGPLVEYLVTTVGFGVMTIGVTGLHAWLWNLLIAAQEENSAQGRLAAARERLRFGRDVHDLLGHTLSVIALKAELAERLVSVDAARAEQEAAAVRLLAASALADLRKAVHGYRTVDLRGELDEVSRVLRSSGIRCTVTDRTGELPVDVAAPLSMVLREAGTNVLRHSTASWCSIELSRHDDEVRMTVTNDGAAAVRPDRHSSGLRGLRERLAETGGTLDVRADGGLFVLESAMPVPS